ncbi:MFS transporter [Actinoplanes sp. TBRC 11911]|uniref:MFS transporter n=1 Tax=Actinoplanes sp. TBRC 11911 TaxID=2729386 RepID=UPI00145D8B62|nr:MFS transporter [Actinoplanes sp. TBRC 11911]NMO54767.1 MFS transporter [Actinoplanes sp. TBRC 11911]
MTRLPAAYRRLQGAAIVSNVGDGAFAAAVPLLAVAVTRDPRLVSLVSAATTLPWLLLSLPTGALVDRYDRAGLMWRAQAGQAVVAAVVAVAVAAGAASIPVLVGAAFVLGACEVVVANAAQAILPGIVPAADLQRANGRQFAATSTANTFAGPPLGSLLFGVAAALPFGLDAATFAVSAAVLRKLPRGERLPAPVPLGRAVAEGLRWLAGHRLLRTLALLLAANLFCFQLANVTVVLFATQVLGLGAPAYGLLLTGSALGGVAGAMVNHRIAVRLGTLPTVLLALGGAVPAYLLTAASPDVYVLGLLLTVIGFFSSMWNVVTVTLRQSVVPAELLGRVNSVYRMLGMGLTPLGAVAGGFVAHGLGVRAGFAIAGVLRGGALLLALPALLSALHVRPTLPRGQGQASSSAVSSSASSSEATG